MALEFTCPSCGGVVTVRFLRVGEAAECRRCGTRTAVPAEARHVDDAGAEQGFDWSVERSDEEAGRRGRWEEVGSGPPPGGWRAPVPRGEGAVTVGSLLSRSVGAYGRNFLTFTMITFVSNLPVLAWVFWVLWFAGDPEAALDSYSSVAVQIIAPVLALLGTGAIALGVIEQLRGRRVRVGPMLGAALSRLLPMIGVAIIAGVAIGVGTLLFVIPGIIIMCMLWLAVPVCVLERAGVSDSLSRSYALTEGYKGRIFGFLFLVGLIEGGIALALGFIAASGMERPEDFDPTIILYGGTLLSLVTGSLRAVGAAVAYHDIVSEREGGNVDDLVAVFE
jgi:hypothetical protein